MQGAGAAGEFTTADVAQDGEEPRLDLRSAKGVEMAQRTQVALLHGIFGVATVAEQVSGQRVNVVEAGQRGVAKPPRFILLPIAAVARHRVAPHFPGRCQVALCSIEHHPPTASTTTVPVMCGCTEQK